MLVRGLVVAIAAVVVNNDDASFRNDAPDVTVMQSSCKTKIKERATYIRVSNAVSKKMPATTDDRQTFCTTRSKTNP